MGNKQQQFSYELDLDKEEERMVFEKLQTIPPSRQAEFIKNLLVQYGQFKIIEKSVVNAISSINFE